MRDEIADAFDGLKENFVGLAARVDEREIVVAEKKKFLVWDRDERVDVLGELREPDLRAARALAAFEEKRFRHDADRERAFFFRELRDDRRATRSGSAAHARRDEHHVGARHELFDSLNVFERRLATALGIGASAKTLRHVRADGELRRSCVRVERLCVRVDDDELDAVEPEVDHRVDRVAAGAAAANHFDACLILLRFVRELDAEAHVPSSRRVSSADSRDVRPSLRDPKALGQEIGAEEMTDARPSSSLRLVADRSRLRSQRARHRMSSGDEAA